MQPDNHQIKKALCLVAANSPSGQHQSTEGISLLTCWCLLLWFLSPYSSGKVSGCLKHKNYFAYQYFIGFLLWLIKYTCRSCMLSHWPIAIAVFCFSRLPFWILTPATSSLDVKRMVFLDAPHELYNPQAVSLLWNAAVPFLTFTLQHKR